MEQCTSLVREKQYTVLILKCELTKFNGECDSGLKRFNGKLCLIMYSIEDRVRQNCWGDAPLSHKAQKGVSCFLNSCSERNLGAAGSRLSPTLGQWFTSKGLYIYMINPRLAKILKFSMLLVTYQESVVARSLSVSRSSLERHP